MARSRIVWLLCLALPFPLGLANVTCGEDSDVATAYEHLQKGRYAEALEVLDGYEPAEGQAVRTVLLRSRALEAQGRSDEALETVRQAAQEEAENAALLARLAELQFRRGDYEKAAENAAAAVTLDPRVPFARLVQADIDTELGRLKEAGEGYRWCVRYYNQFQPTGAETLLVVGRGAAQYARWNGAAQIFSFVVNTIAPDAIKDDPQCWQAHLLAGELLLEKYNRAQGIPELKRALAINPRAAEVLVLLGIAAYDEHEFEEAERYADQALEVNPDLSAAWCLKADLRISSVELDEALQFTDKALEVNPHDQQALARKAACYVLMDGPPDADKLEPLLSGLDRAGEMKFEKADRFTKLVLELARRNPRPGYFFSSLAKTLDRRWKFDLAERFYLVAVERMPQLAEPRTSLGMLYMRMGRGEEAAKVLDDAFKADPYHVRVSNMRKVLQVLERYETIATDHFVIRVDSEADRIFGQYLAEYLEEIYPELTEQFGYEPPHRTQFEIFHHAKGLAAHQWFSARMVGLPWVQTIGASTGMMVAMESPTAADEPFNWARVVKHEFVHILTLQQTGFNIPHWFTEALAVTAEGFPRPEEWNRLLRQRVPKGELRTLKNLNDGFIRPKSPEDWQFAYCQSRLYAQYMTETFGPESIPQLLQAYRENLSTEEAIRKVLGVELGEFETGYREYLDRIVATLPEYPEENTRSFGELERNFKERPDDAAAAAAFAERLLEAGNSERAREVATKSLEQDPRQGTAALVLARLETHARNVPAATRVLERALDFSNPETRALKHLAQLKLLSREYARAAELLELGRKIAPDDVDWLRGLSLAYKETGETAKRKEVLQTLAELDPDDAAPRKALAQIALDEKEYNDAVKHGRQALHVDVLDADVHTLLGDAYRHTGDLPRSIREYEVALKLEREDARLGLARALIAAGRQDDARSQLDKLLESDPDHAEARKLRDTLD